MKEKRLNAGCVVTGCNRIGTKNIMIVDDEELLNEVLTSFIDIWGYTPIPVHHTEEAIEVFDTMRREGLTPDLVLMDIQMPNKMINGFQCADYLKDKYDFDNVIYLSGAAHDWAIRQELRRRNRPFMAKPFEFSRLQEIVAECVGSPQTRLSQSHSESGLRNKQSHF